MIAYVLVWSFLFADGSGGGGSPQLRFSNMTDCVAAQSDFAKELYHPPTGTLRMECVEIEESS